jgi:hypothetical protein
MSRGHFVLKPRRDELARKDESAAEHCPMTADGSIGLCPTLCSSSGPTTALPAARTEQDSRPEMGAATVFATSVFAARGDDVRDTWSPGFPASRAEGDDGRCHLDARPIAKSGH